MSRILGGSKIEQGQKELISGLTEESTGEIWCVPWTGVDVSGKHILDGFEYETNDGLHCWIVPVPIVQHYNLVPAIVNGHVKAYRDGVLDITTAHGLRGWEYVRLLETWLRRVKIAGPETEYAIHPTPEEYLVRAYGPWKRVKSGDLIAKRDPTGQRFLKPAGVIMRDDSRIKNSDSVTTEVPTSDAPEGGTPGLIMRPPPQDYGSPILEVPTPVAGAAAVTRAATIANAAAQAESQGDDTGTGVPPPGEARTKKHVSETSTTQEIARTGEAEQNPEATVNGTLHQDPYF